tara:strand:+ start:248 stop:499 length:252 start_codon:yes stop_codon:yes gene_type:complete
MITLKRRGSATEWSFRSCEQAKKLIKKNKILQSNSMQGKEVILMAAAGEVFVCEKCGNMLVVIKAGGNPEVHCCGEAMKKKEL